MLAVFWSGLLSAQSSLTVPVEDPAYFHLRNLITSGLVSSAIAGTRPFTRAEFARLIHEANRTLAEQNQNAVCAQAQASLAYLSSRFANAPVSCTADDGRRVQFRRKLFDWVGIELLNYNAPARRLSDTTIAAEIQPLTAYRDGRTYFQGQNVAIETGHALEIGHAASFYYQGRVLLTHPANALGLKDRVDFETLRMYVQFSKWNINLLIGKDSIIWGTGSKGNLILSRNARPVGSFNTLPLIKLSNRLPVRLPWLFKSLGRMRYELFVARLGRDRDDFARPYFIGKRLNFKPGRTTEFGLSHAFILGGKNFPVSFTFWDALAEFFFSRVKQKFIFNIGFDELQAENNIANHFMGVDFLIRLPRLRNTEVFSEVYFDDITFNLQKTFDRNLGYYGGIYIPRLTSTGQVSVRMEFSHTSTIFYTGSAPLIAGFTYNRRILGSELGPRANEVFVETGFRPNLQTEWSLSVDFQKRGAERGAREAGAFVDENRLIFGVRLTRQVRRDLNVTLDLRYQRIQAFAHLKGDNRDTYLAGVSFHFTPTK
ncbi:MAG: capsule assembly Wzi family protein [bacterium]